MKQLMLKVMLNNQNAAEPKDVELLTAEIERLQTWIRETKPFEVQLAEEMEKLQALEEREKKMM